MVTKDVLKEANDLLTSGLPIPALNVLVDDAKLTGRGVLTRLAPDPRCSEASRAALVTALDTVIAQLQQAKGWFSGGQSPGPKTPAAEPT